MRKLTKILLLILLLSAIRYPLNATYAAVPHLINYQGRLTDASGTPLNGSYTLTFRIYDAETAGVLLWQGTYVNVSVNKGIFAVLLGDISDTGYNFANLTFDKPYFLEIKVGNEVMSPRQRITSAGYAIRAERAENAEKIDGISAGGDLAGTYPNPVIGSGKVTATHMAAGACWRHSGTQVFSGASPNSFTDLDLSSVVGNNRVLVMLKVKNNGDNGDGVAFRTKGDTEEVTWPGNNGLGAGCSGGTFGSGNILYIIVETNSSGVVQWRNLSGAGRSFAVTVVGYIK